MFKRVAFYILIACASAFMIFGGYMVNKVTVRNISSPSSNYYINYNARGGEVYISNAENIIIISDYILIAFSICGVFIFAFVNKKSK